MVGRFNKSGKIKQLIKVRWDFTSKVKSCFYKKTRMKLKQLFAISCLGLTLQVQAAPFIRLGELNVKLCQHGRKSR